MLSSNLYFANSNNDSTSDSSVTPQTPLKGSETPSTTSIPDEEKKKSIRHQNDINTKSDIADNKSDKKDSFDTTKKIKELA